MIDKKSFLGDTWLNNDVVNFYFQLIEERSNNQSNFGRLSVKVFPSVFYEFYKNNGFDAVADMTERMNIFEKSSLTFFAYENSDKH